MESHPAVYTVSQIAGYIKDCIESNPVLQDVWISGEVGNFRRYSSGHSYFSLRDSGGSIQAVMFRGGRGAEFLQDGLQIVAHGRVSYYAVRGDLQFYADMVRPEGLGALQIAFEKLKQKLEAEGLFDPARKRALPQFPKRIAVVTSPSGAVLQDILNILRRRYPLLEVLVVPTPVQGETAAPGIVAALGAVNQTPDIDLTILARGGGSLEDLWPFNEEIVARAIYASRVPVVSAIGHETDVTIADYVADLRAPTPSAAAELVVPDMSQLRLRVRESARTMSEALRRRLVDARTTFDLAVDRLGTLAPDTTDYRARIDDLMRTGKNSLVRMLELRRAQLQGLDLQLSALSPMRILGRGYAVVRLGAGGPVVTTVSMVKPAESLEITLVDGVVDATAHEIRPSPDRV
ncbi:MAG: exodeoxyribonuclease VII large subunit [Chloroflexi bacterium]|nr:exodeoxyribonuclease VII large subunit [Chloroflexota bacterium]